MINKAVYNLPFDEYRKRLGLSGSSLRYLAASPAMYKSYLDGEIIVENQAVSLGTAIHCFLESESLYDETFIVKNGDLDRRTKAGKEAYAELIESGKTIISREDDVKVRRIVKSYYNSTDPLLRMVHESPGSNETSWFWTNADHGLQMKGRIDRIIAPNQTVCTMLAERFPSLFNPYFSNMGFEIVVDYKTTSKSISPSSFANTIKYSGYDLAAVHYLEATNADAFIWVVFETVPPYGIARYFLSQEHRFEAAARRLELIDKLARCYETNEWPGVVISDDETLI